MNAERHRLSPENLKKEAKHIIESPLGNGIIWNVVRRGEEVISRIFYGVRVDSESELLFGKMELLLFYPGEPYVVPREPEPEELFQFTQLASYALPESRFTDPLKVEVADRLENKREGLKNMIDEINGWGKQELEDTSIPHQQEEE